MAALAINPDYETVSAALKLGFALAFVMLWLVAIGLWWHSLKAASALTAAPVDAARRNARAEAKRLRESGESMDPERWRTLVEEPVLKLSRETLRTLSDGWGLSVLLVGAGLVLFAVFWGTFLKTSGTFSTAPFPTWESTWFVLQLLSAAVIAGFGVLPFGLAWEPASVSSMCARL